MDHFSNAIVTETEPVRKPTLAERGIYSADREVGSWDLWVQNYPDQAGYAATMSITAKIRANGALCNTSLNLPLPVAFALAELINEVRCRIEAAGAGAEPLPHLTSEFAWGVLKEVEARS